MILLKGILYRLRNGLRIGLPILVQQLIILPVVQEAQLN